MPASDSTDPLNVDATLRRLEGVAGDPAQTPENIALFAAAAALIKQLSAKLGEKTDV
jgi:hypothetical protein